MAGVNGCGGRKPAGRALLEAIAKDFETARSALLDAATAVDANRPREAEQYLRTLRLWCDAIIARLGEKPTPENEMEKLRA
jgi:hypothetical protein